MNSSHGFTDSFIHPFTGALFHSFMLAGWRDPLWSQAVCPCGGQVESSPVQSSWPLRAPDNQAARGQGVTSCRSSPLSLIAGYLSPWPLALVVVGLAGHLWSKSRGITVPTLYLLLLLLQLLNPFHSQLIVSDHSPRYINIYFF